MKKRMLAIAAIVTVTVLSVSAQEGNRQAGMRFGYSYGLFYQSTVPAGNSEVGALLMASFRNGGFQATGIKVTYEYALGSLSPDFKLVWGYGGHVGFMYTDNITSMGEDYSFPDTRFLALIGVDGYAGIEYTIPGIPVTLNLNFKPFVEMVTPAFFKFVPYDFGFSISYTF
jgi:hypothetical protein